MKRAANRNYAQTVRAKALRHESTVLEQKLWSALLGDKLGVTFNRQFTVGPYSVDFYCASAKLAVELDGHLPQPTRPTARARFMSNKNVRVLHVSNQDLIGNFAGVLASIQDALNATPKRPVYPDDDLPTPS